MEIADGRLLLGKGETALAIGIANDTLDQIVDAGELRYVLVGKRRRFKPDDIATYIRKQERLCPSEEDRPPGPGGRNVASCVIRRPGEGFWREDFYVQGHRFRSSLGTDSQAEAEALAAASRAEKLSQALEAGHSGAAPADRRALRDLTVSQAEARYLIEVGQDARTADDIKRMGRVIVDGLGGGTRLVDVTFGQLSAFVATRRMRRSKNKREMLYRANGSINREIGHFRTVMLQAKRWACRRPTSTGGASCSTSRTTCKRSCRPTPSQSCLPSCGRIITRWCGSR